MPNVRRYFVRRTTPHSSQDRITKNNIKNALKKMESLLKCVSKNDIEFTRIKVRVKIPSTERGLNVLFISKDKIIVKRM